MATQYTIFYDIPYPQLYDPTPQWTSDQAAAMVKIDELINEREVEFDTHASTKTAHSGPYEEQVPVTSGLITDGFYTLTAIPVEKSEVIALNGILLQEGASNAYTIVDDVVTFGTGLILTVGDVLLFKYWS